MIFNQLGNTPPNKLHVICALFDELCFSLLALLRRATVYYHMENFQMAAEDLRVVLREEPQNTTAVVSC